MAATPYQERMKQLRENPETSRSGLPWDEDDEKYISETLANHHLVNSDLLKTMKSHLKRTENAIFQHILKRAHNAFSRLDALTEKECNEQHITLEDYTTFLEKQSRQSSRKKMTSSSTQTKEEDGSRVVSELKDSVDQLRAEVLIVSAKLDNLIATVNSMKKPPLTRL